jgi:hypothetical protein
MFVISINFASLTGPIQPSGDVYLIVKLAELFSFIDGVDPFAFCVSLGNGVKLVVLPLE